MFEYARVPSWALTHLCGRAHANRRVFTCSLGYSHHLISVSMMSAWVSIIVNLQSDRLEIRMPYTFFYIAIYTGCLYFYKLIEFYQGRNKRMTQQNSNRFLNLHKFSDSRHFMKLPIREKKCLFLFNNAKGYKSFYYIQYSVSAKQF